MDKILNMELSPEDEKLLRESLLTWKEGVYADLMEEVETIKTEKIEELEEANRTYQDLLKEEFAEKMLVALDEMRSELKAEVISEMVTSNPELQVLEGIKQLIAPTLNEEYLGNMFAEEIQTLREQNESYKRLLELDEGAQTLADLIAPYSRKTQNIILAMIKEGNSEEVTEQFYELIESLELISEEDEYDTEDDTEDDEPEMDFAPKFKELLKAADTTKKDFEDDIDGEDEKGIKKAVKDLIKDAEEFECEDEEGLIAYVTSEYSDDADTDDDDDDDDDADDVDDTEVDEDYDDDDDSYIFESGEKSIKTKKINSILSEMVKNAKS